MAKTPQKNEEEGAPVEENKKLPLKTILVFLAVMLVEGGAITTVFLVAGGPAKVEADVEAQMAAELADRPTTLEVVADRFQNTKTGRTYLYDTEVYVVVRQKDRDVIEKKLEELEHQLATDIAKIIRRAEPAHLLEPTLTTLTRQFHAAIEERLGTDDEGNSMVQEVLIRKCQQYRADL